MAVALDSYLPFDSGAGATVLESQWRDMAKHFVASSAGVIRGFGSNFNCFGDSSGMQVKVSTGECWMRGHYGSTSSQKTLAIAANSSGNPRIDIAVIRVHFGNNNIVLDIVQGTPGASPVAPNVTQNTSMWETKLADIAVANGAATITAGNVTDQRTYTTVFAKASRSTTLNVPLTTYTVPAFDTIDAATADVTWNAAGGVATLQRSGIWTLDAGVGWAANSAGGRRIIIADSADNSYYRTDTPNMGASEQTYQQTSGTRYLAAGSTVKVRLWNNVGGGISTVAGWLYLSMTWIGP